MWHDSAENSQLGIESVEHVRQRIERFLDDLWANRENLPESILIVTHSGVIQMLHHLLERGKLGELKRIHNCAIYILQLTK